MHGSVAQPHCMYIAISKPLMPNPEEVHLVGRTQRHIIPWASLPHVCSKFPELCIQLVTVYPSLVTGPNYIVHRHFYRYFMHLCP